MDLRRRYQHDVGPVDIVDDIGYRLGLVPPLDDPDFVTRVRRCRRRRSRSHRLRPQSAEPIRPRRLALVTVGIATALHQMQELREERAPQHDVSVAPFLDRMPQLEERPGRVDRDAVHGPGQAPRVVTHVIRVLPPAPAPPRVGEHPQRDE